MKCERLLNLVALFALLLSLCNSKPAKEEKVKKGEDESKGVPEELLKLIEQLHLEYFGGDPILEQYVDTVRDSTSYKVIGSTRRGPSVYERKSNDNFKEYLVLSSAEDKIPVRKTKNIYVALRRAGDDGNKYHPFFIYLRNPLDKEEGAVSVGGQKKIVEYDTWVNREDKYQSLERRFGWDECSSSIFVPCKTTQTMGRVTPRENKKSNKMPGIKAKGKLGKKDALEVNENSNLFWDLDDGEDGSGQLTLFSPDLAGAVATGNGGLPGQARGRGFLGGLLGGGNGCGGGGFLAGIFGGGGPCYQPPMPYAYGGYGGGYGGGFAPPNYGGYPAGYAPNRGGYQYGGGGGVGGIVNGALGTAGNIVNSAGNLVSGILGGRRRRRSADNDAEEQRKIKLDVLQEVSVRLNNLLGEELLKTDLYTYPGWKTMDSAGSPNDTLSRESDAFVGFGTCIYKKVTKPDYDKAKTPEQVLLVLAAALRTYCIEREVTFYDSLLSAGFIQMNAEKTFDLSADNKYIKREKLSPRRRSELSRAFETSLFSKAFKAELYSKTPRSAPANSISRRVYVLGQVILDGIGLALTTFKHHQIKLLRSLVMTANTGFMKLLQDYEGMRDCEKCNVDLDVNRADQVHLMTLLKFVVYGLAPALKNPKGVNAAFTAFSNTHSQLISDRVGAYL